MSEDFNLAVIDKVTGELIPMSRFHKMFSMEDVDDLISQLKLVQDDIASHLGYACGTIIKKGRYAGKYRYIVDYIDRDLIDLSWHIRAQGKLSNVYARVARTVNWRTPNEKCLLLHRVIMERVVGRPLTEIDVIDHVNSDALDNRRSNLRIVTAGQNTHVKQRSNKYGYKGIRKVRGGYAGQIVDRGTIIDLGSFHTAIEAHEAYCRAAIEYHGELAEFGDNSPYNGKIQL